MTMQSEQGMAPVDDSRGQHSHSETCAACSSGQQAPLRTRFSLHSQKAKAGIRSAMRRIIATVNPEPVMRRNTSKRLALKGRMSISRLVRGRQVMIFFAWEEFWGPQPGATDFVSVSGLMSVSGDPLDASSCGKHALHMGMPRVAGSSAADGTARVTWNPLIRPGRAGWGESVWRIRGLPFTLCRQIQS